MKDQPVVHSYSVVISILHVLCYLECQVWLVLIHRARKIKSVQVCGNAPFKVGPTLHRNRMPQRRLAAGNPLEISINTQTCIRIAKNKPPASRFKLPPSSEVHMVFSFQGYRSRITIGSLQPRTASSSPLTSSPWVWTSTGHGMWYDMVTDHVWRPMFSNIKTNEDQPSMAVLAPDFGWFCTFYSNPINVLVHTSCRKGASSRGSNQSNQPGPTVFLLNKSYVLSARVPLRFWKQLGWLGGDPSVDLTTPATIPTVRRDARTDAWRRRPSGPQLCSDRGTFCWISCMYCMITVIVCL